jgi:methylated-DNA-[protein]-cysteine S-methyltransferase
METLVISEGALPLQLDLFTTEQGLREVHLLPSTTFCCRFVEGKPMEEVIAFLKAYSEKKPIPLNFALDWGNLKGLRRRGLGELLNIGWGKTRSYGEIASQLGSKNLARAVGAICRTNPWPFFIPCHRVTAANNKLGGFAYELTLKELLLRFES